MDSPSQKSVEEEKEEELEQEQTYEEKEMIDEEVPVEQEPEAQEEEPQNMGTVINLQEYSTSYIYCGGYYEVVFRRYVFQV